DLPEEHQMFQKAIRDFAEKEVSLYVNECEDSHEMPMELFRKMGKLGYLCPSYPEEMGGGGLGKLGDCLLYEEVSRINAGIAGSIMIQGGVGTYAIYKHGTEKQINDCVIPVIKGEKITAFALSEPNAGSDAAALQSTAVKNGDTYVLNGTKMFITCSPKADFMIVAAYTDKSKGATGGVTLFIVEKGTPGLTVNKLHKIAMYPNEAGEVFLDECRIPVENVIGEVGKGFRYLMQTLAAGRIVHSSLSVGLAQAAYEASLEHAKTRVQFGKPIGCNQGIAFKISRMAIDIEAARWMTYRAAWLLDNGRECNTEASMAKVMSSETCVNIGNEAMQIHGGYGFMTDSPIQRFWRDSRTRTVTEGTTEIQLTVIARALGLKPS
ncbi:MAG: acyl-CoA dehydrogenase family protein, partial [Dehalococcoidia bacterium]|nr:acyl-CoA dehydrogenase family protein [Dehalococcoidia bacterium]